MAVAQGTHTLPDGRMVVAGMADIPPGETDITFQSDFAAKPIVLTSVLSTPDSAKVDSAPSNVTGSGFRVTLQNADATGGSQGPENVGYIAVAAGAGPESGTASLHGGLAMSKGAFPLGASFSDPVILGGPQTSALARSGPIVLGETGQDDVQMYQRDGKRTDKDHAQGHEELGIIAFDSGPIQGTTTPSGVIPCFTRDTRIETPSGPRPVRDLLPGDLVVTLDHGLQQVLWISRKRLTREFLQSNPEHRPIRVRRGALGPGQPQRELVVSPQHCIAITDPSFHHRFGSARILVPAKSLVDGVGIDVMPANRGWTYFHLLLPTHSLIMAEGCVTESLSALAAGQLRVPSRFNDLPIWSATTPLPNVSVKQAQSIWTDIKSGNGSRRTCPSPAPTPASLHSPGAEIVSIRRSA